MGDRMKLWSLRLGIASLVAILAALAFAAPARAQFGPNAGAPPPKLNPHTDAPFDPSGYWVAVVTEDWRYRMVTPDKGDFPGVPVNAAGRKIAEAVGPRQGSSFRKCVQVVWSRRDHARAGAPAYFLGE